MTVIILSDGSYNPETKKSGISIKDTWLNESITETLENCKSSHEAEIIALEKSINYAIEKNYSDPIFMYDDKKIDINNLKKKYFYHFKTIQFVWVSREYLSVVDELAKTARKEKENYNGQTREHINIHQYKNKKIPKNFSDFLLFNDEEKLKFFINYTTSKGNRKLYESVLNDDYKNLTNGHRKYLEVSGVYNFLTTPKYKSLLLYLTSEKRKESVSQIRSESYLKKIFNECYEVLKNKQAKIQNINIDSSQNIEIQ